MADVTATWSISLDCDCPACGDHVDLLADDDFWIGRPLDCVEHHTARSRDVEVFCPACHHEFKVDLDY